MLYKINIRSSGNALSLIATYPFSQVAVSMALFEEGSGNIIKLERTSSLETHAVVGLSSDNDMATFIEIPSIDAGSYTLEIVMRRALFLPTKQYPTCLTFTLVAEYVHRDDKGTAADGKFEVFAVFPMTETKLLPDSEKTIEVDFDRDFAMDDFVNSLADRFYICSLYN